MSSSPPDLRALAHAKVNLSLRVRSPDASGLHPIRSLMQSIGWSDVVEMAPAEEDRLEVFGFAVPDDPTNLVWQAVDRLREETEGAPPVAVRLDKQIPPAAGLGGGSADAAAALLLYARLAGIAEERLTRPAAAVGSDVPFSLRGGRRWVEGRGEEVGDLVVGEDFWVAVVVPPFELSTGRVYREWDRMGGPEGEAFPDRALPPSLRDQGPLVNDLYGAAVSLSPELDDWRAELEGAWGRPVLMSGSGPALFGLFPRRDEARGALGAIPTGVRARRAAATSPRGVEVRERYTGRRRPDWGVV